MRSIVLVSLLLALAGVPAPAQESAGSPAPEAAATFSQVPILPPPATTRTYVHVYLAFGAAFLLMGGYAVRMGRRIDRLGEDGGRGPE